MRFAVIASKTAMLSVIGLVAALPLSSAYAACTRPNFKITIPDGATATEAEMKTAAQALVKVDQEMSEYLRCIKGDASQSTVGKDEATREKLVQAYVDAHNSTTDELAGLAACYNDQVEAFRTTKGGPGGKTADCSAQMAAAKVRTDAPAPGGTPRPSSIVKEADGYSFELEGGAWSYTLIRDETPRYCGGEGQKHCLRRTVFVTNGSDQDLECKAYIKYDGTDAKGNPQPGSQAVVLKKSIRAVTASMAEEGVGAATFEASCKPRQPLPALKTEANCKYEVVKPVNISDFYPDEARQLDEQGPVVVEFTVPGKAASPTDVKVVASSLSARLDQGAVQAVSAMIMSSQCKNQRYRLRLNFQLEE
ncbi:energy transducer TonB [Steroidobacter cummioxidans]|uniref:energy transducer TonB n=1 Tax=Steroidobacter cummioxidans TaxID=1803913 RepID=UPI000E30F861|nr:energy transducer TonB [Steroidobacter cummioxidans]